MRNVGDEFDIFRTVVGQMMEDFDQSFLSGGRGRGGRGDRGLFNMLPGFFPSYGRGGDRGLLGTGFGDQGVRDDQLILGDTIVDQEQDDALALPSPFAGPLDVLRGSNLSTMKIDVEEEKDKYVVTAEAPGFKKEDLHVRVENGMLEISGEHKEERKKEDKQRKMLRSERLVSSVRRVIALSGDTEQSADKVKAHYKDGLLKIEITKTPHDEHAGRVEISSGEDSSHNSGGSSSGNPAPQVGSADDAGTRGAAH